MPVADCGDYAEIPLSPQIPVGRLRPSRWASVARSVSSNPTRKLVKLALLVHLAKRDNKTKQILTI